MINNICIITTGLGMGGAEKQLCDLADSFEKKNKTVIILSLSHEKIINRPNSKNIKIYQLNMKKGFFSFFNSLYKAAVIIKKFNPDVVHSHMFHANIFARLLRLFVQIPILVSTAHNSNEGGKLRMLAYKATNNLATISTNVSQEAVDSFVKKKAAKKDKMTVMYNGIDIDRFTFSQQDRIDKRQELGISEKETLLLAVGRLTEAKDYPNMLNAFASNNIIPKPHLAIIGVGEDQKMLMNLASQLSIEDNIHWLGLRNDVHKWMSACDLFILSSSWEGFGLVVAEAMLCERVVVATDCGGVKEVIGQNGILVPKKNSKELAKAIESILSMDILTRENMGFHARKHIVANFSLDEIANQWLNLYLSLEKKK